MLIATCLFLVVDRNHVGQSVLSNRCVDLDLSLEE